ncbi:ATP-binding protein [Actinotalea sp. K2]|uniref:ATP-binding protein n=1 Tax=Actinotalea sp. K2 TaxID=2939438 RepID=UPI002017768E|nr:ATP-binding protein [Actinotalea sp. K2]MCL3862072.1 ATP-binding protein [Actinotalea sp. K2]
MSTTRTARSRKPGRAFRTRAGRLQSWLPLRLPPHRASSSMLAGAYPFLSPPPPPVDRALVGTDALTGERFAFDPWDLYAAGALTNPNVLLAGVIGQGKSALAKSLAIRSIAYGRRVYVPADPKGEWAVVAEAVGGTVVRLVPGSSTRINPLDVTAADPLIARGQRLRLLTALVEATLERPLAPPEHSALDAALRSAVGVCGDRQVTVPDLALALADPDPVASRADGTSVTERSADGRDLLHAVRRLIRGDLAGLFDGPSTVTLDRNTPMLVLDLSALDDETLAVAMTCAAGWVESAIVSPDSGPSWVIYDEAWRVLRLEPLVRRMQAQWKLARAYGLANLLILHRLSDLDAAGDVGSRARSLAAGLLADCSTRIVYRQESDQVGAAGAALGLSTTERDVLTALPRGTGLWSMPGRSYVVHHLLHPDELAVLDTDQAFRLATADLTGGPPC